MGPFAAGKTTLLVREKHGKVINNIGFTQSIGFTVEDLHFAGQTWNVWDIGSRHWMKKTRYMVRQFYPNTRLLVLMLDCTAFINGDDAPKKKDATSNDWRAEHRAMAKEMSQEMLTHELLRSCPLLVFSNKQDLVASSGHNAVGLRGESGGSDSLPVGEQLLVRQQRLSKLSGVVDDEGIANFLGLTRLASVGAGARLWRIQPCCALTGEGVAQGFAWVRALCNAVLPIR